MKNFAVYFVISFLLLGNLTINIEALENNDPNELSDHSDLNDLSDLTSTSDHENDPTDTRQVNSLIGSYFTLNEGQIPYSNVHFHSQNAYFTTTGVIFRVLEDISNGHKQNDNLESEEPTERNSDKQRMHIYEMKFLGANSVVPLGRSRLPNNNNYFKGNEPSKWFVNVANFQEIIYENLYDNIDLLFRATSNGIKYEFIVYPGGNYRDVQLEYAGVKLTNDRDNLYIHTSVGTVIDGGLYVYQINNEQYQKMNNEDAQVPINTKIRVEKNIVRYDIDETSYDPEQILVIDPLIYSTYIGGDDDESAFALVVDSAINSYIAGWTSSMDFPISAGAFNETLNVTLDAFVLKLNSAGTNIIYSTYIGGTNEDKARAIAVDTKGNAYVAGYTMSADFPVTKGALYSKYEGGLHDTFLLKLDPIGISLKYSTFIGGKEEDYAYGIILDKLNNVYVTGYTGSSDFPTTTGAFSENYDKLMDVFVFKFNLTNNKLVYSTFVGGEDDDKARDIEVDSSGNAYVTGYTKSTDLPTTSGALFEDYTGGEFDAFVFKLNATGAKLVYSTYYGGAADDKSFSIALDPINNAYITGYTYSLDLPTNQNAFDRSYNDGLYDVFIAKLNQNGASLEYSTYIGGDDEEKAYSIDLDSQNNAYITGYTWSSNFPITNGSYSTKINGIWEDAFVLILNPNGDSLNYSTYIGGSNEDYGYAIAVDSYDNAYITGVTDSSDFPTSKGAYDPNDNEWEDVFIMKMGFPRPPHAPVNLTRTTGTGYIELTWEPPKNNGSSPITNYKIYRGISVDKLKAIEIIGALNEFNDTSVTNAITYYYAITTMNAIGESKKSTIIYAIPGGPPTAPRNLNTEVGDGYIFLTWNHPLNNNGFPIINYAIYRGKAANNLTILTTIGNITSYNDTSTKNGVDYFYAVSAFNTKGEGKASDEVTTAAGNPPSVPLNLVAEKVEDYVLLTWDIPSDNGGFEITFYRIYRGLNEIEFNEIAETDQLNYFDSSTIGGVAYYYSVSAINIKGEGERSDVVPVKPIEPLGKPDNITTEGGNGYVFISWEPPVNSYGTTISRYNLYKGTNPLEELQLFSVSLELFFNDTNVENDVTYYYIISAFSTDGEGTKSEIVYATPLKPTGDTNGHLNVPGIPENFIVEAGDGFVYLKWQPPIETHGIEIIGYRIYRGDSESQQPAFYIYTYILTFNDTSVINNNSYYYQLSTVNKFGEGNKTHIAKITPRPWPGPYPGPDPLPGTPSAPENLKVDVDVDNKKVIISWEPPKDNGSEPVLGYRVYRGNASDNLVEIDHIVTLSYIDVNVEEGKRYYYKISGVNIIGEGAPTGILSVTVAEKDEKKEKEKKDDGGLLYLIIPLIIIVPFVLIIFVIMAMHSIRNRKVGSEGKTQQLKQASRAPEPQPKHYPPQAKPVNPNIQGRMKQQKD